MDNLAPGEYAFHEYTDITVLMKEGKGGIRDKVYALDDFPYGFRLQVWTTTFVFGSVLKEAGKFKDIETETFEAMYRVMEPL